MAFAPSSACNNGQGGHVSDHSGITHRNPNQLEAADVASF
jgi:hypothetical protein